MCGILDFMSDAWIACSFGKERLTPLNPHASLGSRRRLALRDKDSIVWSVFTSLEIIAFCRK